MKNLSDYITQYGLSGWKTEVGGAKAPLVMMLRDEIARPGSTVLSQLDRSGLEISFKTLENTSTDERALANLSLPFTSLRIDATKVPQIKDSDDPDVYMTRMDAAFKEYASVVFVRGEKDNPFTQHTDYISSNGVITKDALVGTDLTTLNTYYWGAVSTAMMGANLLAESKVITSKEILTNMLELVLQNGIDTPAHVKEIFGSYAYAPGAADSAIEQEAKLPMVPALSDPTSEQMFKGYIAYFGRPADPSGLQYWVDAINKNGGDVTSMVSNFGNSAEYRNLYGTSSSEEIVNSLYQHLFNRDAEKDGLAFWSHHLDTGALTLSNIAFDVVNAAQLSDATIIAEKVAAARIFTASLDTKREVDLYSNDTSALNARKWLSSVSDNHSDNVKLVGIANDVINALQGDVDPILAGQGFHAIYY